MPKKHSWAKDEYGYVRNVRGTHICRHCGLKRATFESKTNGDRGFVKNMEWMTFKTRWSFPNGEERITDGRVPMGCNEVAELCKKQGQMSLALDDGGAP